MAEKPPVEFTPPQEGPGETAPSTYGPQTPEYPLAQPGYPTVQAGYSRPAEVHPSSFQTTNTTVVVNQPTAVPQQEPRDWSTGLCGCCNDCYSCK